jgi:hypothetical protein
MKQKEIQERNKEISIMLDMEYDPHSNNYRYNNEIYSELAFHINWNMLMEAVEFIERLKYEFHGYIGVHISSNNCTMQGTKLRTDPENFHAAFFTDTHGKNKKEATFIAVSEFAKLYNQKKI